MLLFVLALLSLACAAVAGGCLMMDAPRAQHAGAGASSVNVWDLIAKVEDERCRTEQPTGRHTLREPLLSRDVQRSR